MMVMMVILGSGLTDEVSRQRKDGKRTLEKSRVG